MYFGGKRGLCLVWFVVILFLLGFVSAGNMVDKCSTLKDGDRCWKIDVKNGNFVVIQGMCKAGKCITPDSFPKLFSVTNFNLGPVYGSIKDGFAFATRNFDNSMLPDGPYSGSDKVDLKTVNLKGAIVPSQVSQDDIVGKSKTIWGLVYSPIIKMAHPSRVGCGFLPCSAWYADSKYDYKDLTAGVANPGNKDFSLLLKPADYKTLKGDTVKAPSEDDLPISWNVDIDVQNPSGGEDTQSGSVILCPTGSKDIITKGSITGSYKAKLFKVLVPYGNFDVQVNKAGVNFRGSDGECFPDLDLRFSFSDVNGMSYDALVKFSDNVPTLKLGDFDAKKYLIDHIKKWGLNDWLHDSNIVMDIKAVPPKEVTSNKMIISVKTHAVKKDGGLLGLAGGKTYDDTLEIPTTVGSTVFALQQMISSSSVGVSTGDSDSLLLQFPPSAATGKSVSGWVSTSKTTKDGNDVYLNKKGNVIATSTKSKTTFEGFSATTEERQYLIQKPFSKGPDFTVTTLDDKSLPYFSGSISSPAFTGYYSDDWPQRISGELRPHKISGDLDITFGVSLGGLDIGWANVKAKTDITTAVDTKKLFDYSMSNNYLACCPVVQRRYEEYTNKVMKNDNSPAWPPLTANAIKGLSVPLYSETLAGLGSHEGLFMFRNSTTEFDYTGEGYVMTPPVNLNSPLSIEFYHSFDDPMYFKYNASQLGQFEYNVVGTVSKIIGPEGGNISIGNIKEVIPAGAVSSNVTFVLSMVNITKAYCHNGIKDAREDGVDCGGICGNVCEDHSNDDVYNGKNLVTSVCGDGVCDYPNEFFSNCTADCGAVKKCWDGKSAAGFDNLVNCTSLGTFDYVGDSSNSCTCTRENKPIYMIS